MPKGNYKTKSKSKAKKGVKKVRKKVKTSPGWGPRKAYK